MLSYIYLDYFVSKRVFIKISNELEREGCIGCLLWQKRYFEGGK